MREVAIIGVGTTNYGKLQQGIVQLGVEACARAIGDAGIEKQAIQSFFLGNFAGEVLTGQAMLAALVARGLGLGPIPVTKVEGACASGSIALRQAVREVSGGEVDFAIAVGVEKMSSASTAQVTTSLAGALDRELEGKAGLTFPGFFGLVFSAYLDQFGINENQVHSVVIKSRANASNNPICYLRKPVVMEDIVQSYPVAEPLRLMDCCPISDGAAAAVVCPADLAAKFQSRPVKVLACEHTLGSVRVSDSDSLASFQATVAAAGQAYRRARLTPGDIDVVELHDCFSIAEVVDSEDLGFFKKGEGAVAAASGATSLPGEIPINPSGGLLSRGHPVGATGLAQVFEIVMQLRGEAANQVKGAKVGLTHNLGGPGAICTVTILEKM